MLEIITCQEARSLGLKRYFTGKPCKHGHICERHVTGGCMECARQDCRRYYADNPAKYKEYTGSYRELNRDRCNEIQNNYYARHSAQIKAKAKTYRGLRALRIPSWSQSDLITKFYIQCPPGYEVDHVLPLQGAEVSGLHVIENLQYLTRFDNRSKHNKVPK